MLRFYVSKPESFSIVPFFDQQEIIQVDQIKFVGVILDSRINWKAHIHHMLMKLAKNMFVMSKVRHLINQNSENTLYSAIGTKFVLLYVRGNTFESNIRSSVTIQKTIMRIVTKTKYREHTNLFFLKM